MSCTTGVSGIDPRQSNIFSPPNAQVISEGNPFPNQWVVPGRFIKMTTLLSPNLKFKWPCIVMNILKKKKTSQMHQFLKFILRMKFYMFRSVPLSIIRSFSLYTQQWYTPGVLHCTQSNGIYQFFTVHKAMVYTIAVSTVKNTWRWTEELSETCRVSFKNKFEKSVHLVGFFYKILLRPLHNIKKKWSYNSNRRYWLIAGDSGISLIPES